MKNNSILFHQPEFFPSLSYHGKTVLLGSCFSEHIHNKLRYFGFNSVSNPFGVVFHPLALAKQLENALADDINGELFQHHDVWLHSLASSEIYGLSKSQVLENYRNAQIELVKSLEQSKLLMVTFGSSHLYTLNTTNQIVANCHKQPASTFTKSLSTVDQMRDVWVELLAKLAVRFPDLKVVFTVSPVRYTRDGILENMRSKSHLTELCHELSNINSVSYFPSYELVTDVLRDFSYFELDQSHPNAKAVEEVWELFQSWTVDEEMNRIMMGVKEIRMRENHRLLFPDSAQSKQFTTDTKEKRERFHSLHSYIIW